jgi:plastocyanin
MAAPIRFLSGRQQQQKIGIEGSTEDEKVLEVVGRVGIGTTIFEPSKQLDVRGDAVITGELTVGNQFFGLEDFSTRNIIVTGVSSFTGVSTFTGAIDANGDLDVDGHTELDDLNVSGVSTFVGLGTFKNDLYVNDNVYVSGFVTANRLYSSVFGEFTGSIDAAKIVGASLSITGISTFNGAANFNDTINATDIDVDGHTELDDLNVSGVSTFASDVDINAGLDVDGHTELDDVNVSGAITASTFTGNLDGNAGTATSLSSARNFDISGDFVTAPSISFDGTGDVSFAATITTNSITLGTYTTGDYVESITGTGNQITVTSGTGEGSTPVISIPDNPTLPGTTVTVANDLQVNRNLNVDGNITVGGTSATLFTETLKVLDSNIVLGFRTDANGNDVSNDTTANHGGVAVASTEGSPLVSLVGTGDTSPSTYKKIVWFGSGAFTGLATDAWLSNYAFGVGTTSMSAGTKFAVGNIETDLDDITSVRHINSSGVITASSFVGSGAGLTGITPEQVGAIVDVISDTSPQLGGDLDINNKFVIGTGGIDITGVITATSFSGDGSGLSGVSGGTSIDENETTNQSQFIPFYVSTATTDVSGVSTQSFVFNPSTKRLGIGTDAPTSNLHVEGDVNVSGASTFTGIINATDIDVDGHTELDNLNVSGVSTFSSNVDIDAGLDVDGHTELDNVNASGISSATAFANFNYLQAPFGSTVTLAVTVASKDSTHRYDGTGSGDGYVINGVQAPFLTLTPGRTYRFTNDNTGSHPLKFYLEADRTTLYETNVNFQNTFTEITITDETPVVLHYQCINHGYMGNSVQVNSNVVNTNYDAILGAGLSVVGLSTFASDVDINAGLDVDGHTELDGLNVSGFSTFVNGVRFVGAATTDLLWDGPSNSLKFEDYAKATFGDGVDLTITHSDNQSSISESSGNGLEIKSVKVTITPNGSTEKMAEFNANSSVDLYYNDSKKLETTGYGATVFGETFTQRLNVSGVSTFSSNVDINAGLDVDGHTELDDLNVSGVSTFASDVDIDAGLDVDGHTELDDLNVSGVATFGNTIDINSGGRANTFKVEDLADNSVVIVGTDGELEDSSNLTFDGSTLSVGVNLDVDGHTELDDLNVTGVVTATTINATTFAGNGDFVDIDVDGHTELDDLNVTGVSTFASAIVGSAVIINSSGINATGVITATSFSGDGSGLTGVSGGTALDPNETTNQSQFIPFQVSTATTDISGVSTQSFVFNPSTIRLGIGTDAPTSNLHVEGDATVGSAVTINSSGINATGVITATSFSGDGSGLFGISGGTAFVENSANQSQNIPFYVSTATTDVAGVSTQSFVFNPSTKSLGIGIDNPTSNLHVVGNAKVTGIVTATSFSGSGASLNTLNATNISSGTIDNARLPDLITSNINVSSGVSTVSTLHVSNLTNNRVVIAGASKQLEDDAELTFNGTTLNVGTGITLSSSTNNISITGSYFGDGSELTNIDNQFNSGMTDRLHYVPGPALDTALTFPSTSNKAYILESIRVANVDTSVGVGTTVNIIVSLNDTYIAYNIPINNGGTLELIEQAIVAGPSDVIKMWNTNTGYVGIQTGTNVYISYSTKDDPNSRYFSTKSAGISSDTTSVKTFTANATLESINIANRTDSGDYPVTVSIVTGSTTSHIVKDLVVPKYGAIELLDRQLVVLSGDIIKVSAGTTNTIDVIISGKEHA